MDQDPTTKERAAIKKAMPETVKEPGLPEKVSQLRQKLGQKAKQEPKFRISAAASGHIVLRIAPSPSVARISLVDLVN